MADPVRVPVELGTYPPSQQEVQVPEPDSQDAKGTDEEGTDSSSELAAKSSYEAAPRGSGPTSVEAYLAADDEVKNLWVGSVLRMRVAF